MSISMPSLADMTKQHAAETIEALNKLLTIHSEEGYDWDCSLTDVEELRVRDLMELLKDIERGRVS